jgi:hypothetical protein
MSSRVIKCLVLILAASATLLLSNILVKAFSKTEAHIVVEASVADGLALDVYINDDTRPHSAQITSTYPKNYEVEGIQQTIRHIKLEFSGIKDEFSIRSISILVGGVQIRSFSAEEMRATASNGTLVSSKLPLVSNREAIFVPLDGKVSIDLNRIQLTPRTLDMRRAPYWVEKLGRSDYFLGLILMGFALTVIVNLDRSGVGSVALLSATSLLTVYLTVPLLISIIRSPDLASRSVGKAAFFGISTYANQMSVLSALILSVMFALIIAVVRNNMPLLSRQPERGDFAVLAGSWRGTAALIVTFFVASVPLLSIAPDLAAQSYPVIPGWDTNNLVLWQYLIHEGFRPVRDFWYPYGGSWIFYTPAPWGQIFSAIERTLLYTILFMSLHVIMGRRILGPFIIVSLVLVADRLYIFWGIARYLLAVDVFLAYLAQIVSTRKDAWTRAMFSAAVVLAAFMEPIQVGFAAPAVFLVFLFDVRTETEKTVKHLIRRLANDFGPTLIAGLVYVAILAIIGDLKDQIIFLASLGPQTISSSVPTDLRAALNFDSDLAAAVAICGPCALLAIGVYRCLILQRQSPRDLLLVGMGLIGFLYLQKDIIRENQWQIVLPTVLGLIVWVYLEPSLQRKRSAAIVGITSALILVVLRPTGEPRQFLSQLVTAPFNAANMLNRAIPDDSANERINQFAYSEERFHLYTQEIAVVRRLKALTNGSPGSVYILGDTPQLYILLKQAPPYQQNNFSGAPIEEQQRVLAWIDAKRPRYVIWRVGEISFEIPHVLRVPLLYGRIVRDYVPLEQSGPFAILRQREPNEMPALAWWRDNLTGIFDMGHILRNVSMTSRPSCDPIDQKRCTPVIVVNVAEALRDGRTISVQLRSDELKFELRFATSSLQADYIIPLERLWAYDASTIRMQPLSIIQEDTHGIIVTREGRLRDEHFLY